MTHVDVQQFQASLADYLERAARGEAILVTRDGQPLAEVNATRIPRTTPRPIGLGVGRGTIHPNYFDPLPDHVLNDFDGGDL